MIKSEGILTHSISDRRMTIRLSGEIDHHSALSLRGAADELIYRHRPASVALDLSGIEFMDSSGLGFIMGRYALLKKLGGEIVLLDPNERVEKIISLAGLERIISIERTEKK